MTTFKTGTGFSIEIQDVILKRKGIYEGIPLFEAISGKITAIAIVREPAIEIGSILNDSEKTIFGPVMIPDLKIFRDTGPNGRKLNCYWYFSAVTITQLQKTFTGQIKIGH